MTDSARLNRQRPSAAGEQRDDGGLARRRGVAGVAWHGRAGNSRAQCRRLSGSVFKNTPLLRRLKAGRAHPSSPRGPQGGVLASSPPPPPQGRPSAKREEGRDGTLRFLAF
ncbi:hypothetical protein SKAU_G00187960 [Synaphobranchus kaupii]|uniref:Uncharacterized protein n=1 Tax=Synaphobranchus kaupii TaxID=118154 RepID=A0A9Q1IUX1_SYNKA|nr:hypothetical protein SKAU_G00187960 [Synaphobranchus kaupii]